MTMAPLAIARLPRTTAPVGSCTSLPWDGLAKLLSTPTVGQKDGPAWMPARIQPGARKAERVESISALVLDVERPKQSQNEPPTPTEMAGTLRLLGLASLLHTSYSHQAASPRYRIVLPLARALTSEELVRGTLKTLAQRAADHLGLSDVADPACMEPARLFYLPRCADAVALAAFEFHQTEGAAFDVDAMLAEAPTLAASVRADARHHREDDQSAEVFMEGGRNGALFRIGCALRAKGLSAGAILAALLVENTAKCAPPLADSEVKAIARSASAYTPGETVGGETLQDVIKRLALLPLLEYDRVRQDEADRLEVRVGSLDKEVARVRPPAAVEPASEPFPSVEPWSEAIALSQVLDEVATTIRRYVVLSQEQADAAALWAAFTWFIDAAKVAPLLVITAPEPACGKSQLLDLLAKIVMRPLATSSMRSATMFRIIESWSPSLLLDEVDSMLRGDDLEMANIVNAGYERGACFVWRCVGDDHEPARFNVWGAKAFAGINLHKVMQTATWTRAVVIGLRKKTARERVASLLEAQPAPFERLAAKLARVSQDFGAQVAETIPVMSEALDDRTRNNWRILLAIALCASPEWYERGHRAALVLSGLSEPQKTRGNELLEDIRRAWNISGETRMSTSDMIHALCADDEAPWATHDYGKRITPRQLSNMLKDYGIQAKVIRLGPHDTPRGFERTQFEDAFARYLDDNAQEITSLAVDGAPGEPCGYTLAPAPPKNGLLSATSATANIGAGFSAADARISSNDKNPSATPKPLWRKAVADVADKKGVNGHEEGYGGLV